MGTVWRVGVLAVLVLDSVLLALVELLFLPLYVGSVKFPIAALLAAVATPVLVRQAAAVSRRAAAVPLVVWFVVVFAVGLGGPGGDIVLPGDWRSLLLLAAGTLPAAVAVGRQLRRPDPDG